MNNGYLQSLLREHSKLEQEIDRELKSRAPNLGEVGKLKRVKLLIRDRIAEVRHHLMRTPRHAS
jgi:hypothetical protein